MAISRNRTLSETIKSHKHARERCTRLVNEHSRMVRPPESLGNAVSRAHDAVDKTFASLCRYEPHDAEELVKWLSAVLADEEVAEQSIRVLDGLAVLTRAHNILCKLLVPASEMHAR